MSARTFLSLIRAGFSAEEWTILGARPDFLALANQAASIDDVDTVIKYGADLLEGASPRPISAPRPTA